VGCVGGGAVILAMAAYYLHVVKPAAANSSAPDMRDVESVPVVSPAVPVVAPVALLGYAFLPLLTSLPLTPR
jgi:hypothetical protein